MSGNAKLKSSTAGVSMKRCMFFRSGKLTTPLLMALLLALPLLAEAWGPAEWTQMRQACINSGGQAASAYNTFSTQGCICNGSPSGQPTCSGGSSASGSAGQNIQTIIVNEVIKGILSAPQKNAAQAETLRRQAEEQAARQKLLAEEAAAEQNRLAEAAKNRLLGNPGVTDPTSLALMGVEAPAELALLEGSTESSSGLQLMTGDPSFRLSANPKPPAEPGGSKPKSPGYTKGFEAASQCFSQNSAAACVGVAADQQQTCLDDYRAGYTAGDQQRVQALAEAFRAGEQAGKNLELANGASDPRALGPCRIPWIETYNRGYFQGKESKAKPQ